MIRKLALASTMFCALMGAAHADQMFIDANTYCVLSGSTQCFDGVNDDTQTLQAARDAAPNGATIYIPQPSTLTVPTGTPPLTPNMHPLMMLYGSLADHTGTSPIWQLNGATMGAAAGYFPWSALPGLSDTILTDLGRPMQWETATDTNARYANGEFTLNITHDPANTSGGGVASDLMVNLVAGGALTAFPWAINATMVNQTTINPDAAYGGTQPVLYAGTVNHEFPAQNLVVATPHLGDVLTFDTRVYAEMDVTTGAGVAPPAGTIAVTYTVTPADMAATTPADSVATNLAAVINSNAILQSVAITATVSGAQINLSFPGDGTFPYESPIPGSTDNYTLAPIFSTAISGSGATTTLSYSGAKTAQTWAYYGTQKGLGLPSSLGAGGMVNEFDINDNGDDDTDWGGPEGGNRSMFQVNIGSLYPYPAPPATAANVMMANSYADPSAPNDPTRASAWKDVFRVNGYYEYSVYDCDLGIPRPVGTYNPACFRMPYGQNLDLAGDGSRTFYHEGTQAKYGNAAVPGTSFDFAVNGTAVAKVTDTGGGQFTAMNGGQLAGFRNLLIDGNFAINQRAVSGTVTLGSTHSYGHDRWKGGASGATYTFAAVSNSPDTELTISAGTVEQIIEGADIGGGTYTLSWAGTATCDVDGTSVSKGGNVTLTGGANHYVECGGGTLSDVQLEPGSVATPFERRTVGVETALAQRYFRKGSALIYGYGVAGGGVGIDSVSPVAMRIPPATVTITLDESSNLAAAATPTSSTLSPGDIVWIASISAAGAASINLAFTADAEL